MTGNISDITMFVADMLMDGIEKLANILRRLNYRGIGGWRNASTSNFKIEDVISALVELINQRSIDAWRLGSDGYLNVAEGDAAAILEAAQVDPESLWFRLTTKGREAVEAWKPPRTLDRILIQHLDVAPSSRMSLYFAYQLLNESVGGNLDFAEFEDFVNAMLEYDFVRLWHSAEPDPDKANMIRVPVLAQRLYRDEAIAKPAKELVDPLGYFLTIGEGTAAFAEAANKPTPQLVDATLDSELLLEWIRVQRPTLLRDFSGRKTPLHLVLDDRGGISASTGSISDFVSRTRWSKGLPDIENTTIRHLVLDEADRVIGDYYGPAGSDPLR